MASDPRIRASDADRDRTAALLREHHAAGRLTAEEFNERLDKTYAAKTLGDLDELLADLPGIDLYQLPDASLQRGNRRGPGGPPLPWLMAPGAISRLSPAWRGAWGSWLSVSLITFFVWLLTGHPDNLWFLWAVGPWGLILLGRWVSGSHPHRDRRRRGRGVS
ncbi:MAG TPA: DUF1707 domain-containing protein [Streptosporangiaceae bacterium]|nr:DUF1707 domain-containing protein [Streptosporangiaceae bacterium]